MPENTHQFIRQTLEFGRAGIAAADEPAGESCSVITLEANGAPKTTPVEGFKVMEQTKKDGAFSLPRRAPRGVQAVICKRPTVVPAENDYKVLQASNGAEALSIYAQQKDKNQIAAVLMDMMMPHMDGAATIGVLMRINPSICIIATSGVGGSCSANAWYQPRAYYDAAPRRHRRHRHHR